MRLPSHQNNEFSKIDNWEFHFKNNNLTHHLALWGLPLIDPRPLPPNELIGRGLGSGADKSRWWDKLEGIKV